jgi:branched-subunit amino acid transport protein
MEIEQRIALTILLMALVTYIPRALPLLVLAKFSLPKAVIAWLRYVPVAVLSALLFPALLMPDGKLELSLSNEFLVASLPTLLVAWRTKSLFWTVILGILFVAVLRYWWV